MSPKAKKEEPAKAEEPPSKKAKAEETKDEPKKEDVKDEKEEPKFEEPDAPKDTRAPLKAPISFQTADTTLNVMPAMEGRLLTALSDGGMAYFNAGARASVGQKAGRYMFEIKITHAIQTGHTAAMKPRQMCRVGFSTAESSLLLDENSDCVCFDADGIFISKKNRQQGGQKYGREQVVACVLNLDPKSPNHNTVALYRDGLCIADPKPLPEELIGKALFPAVTFRNIGVYVNFGATALKELPFKCRLLGGAAASDCLVPPSKETKNGKYDVVVPVAFPDEGTFEWLDSYLEENPKYVELSDRKILEWAKSSGVWPKGSGKGASNDKPSFNFGIPAMDDFSVRRVINAVAPLVPRNYIVMEVKSNLMATERKELLKKFNYPHFQKVAHVVMGEPTDKFKTMVQNKILKEKQAKADLHWKATKEKRTAEKAKKKAEAERTKKIQEAIKKKRLEDEAAKKKAEEEAAKKKAEEAKEEGAEDAPKDEPMEEKKEEEPAADEEVKMEEEEEDEEPPPVELTEDEKKVKFTKRPMSDLAPAVLQNTYGRFSTPEADEGFDDIKFEWLQGDKATEYLQKWVMNKRITTRIDDLRPGKECVDKLAEFEKLFKEWQDKLTKYERTRKKPASKDDDDEDDDEVAVSSVKDICDIGAGETDTKLKAKMAGVPLFASFTYEDWELVKLRFELWLMISSFNKDANSEGFTGVPMAHFSYYYTRYFNKNFDPKFFAVNEIKDVFALAKGSVSIEDLLLVSKFGEVDSLDHFVKVTEEQRRERQRRLDAGDETVRLKFLPPPKPKLVEPPKVVAPKASIVGEVAPKLPAPAGAVPVPGKGATVPLPVVGVPAPYKVTEKGYGKDRAKSDFRKGYGKEHEPGEIKGKSYGKDKNEGKTFGKGKSEPAAFGEPKGFGKDKGDGKASGGFDTGKGSDKGYGKVPVKGDDKSKGWGKAPEAGKGDGKDKGKDMGKGSYGKGSYKGKSQDSWGADAAQKGLPPPPAPPSDEGGWGPQTLPQASFKQDPPAQASSDWEMEDASSWDAPKPQEKSWGQPEQKAWGQPEEKSWGQPEEKSWGQPEEKSWGQPEEKSWGQPEEKSWSKPEEKAWGQPEEKSWGKPAEQSWGQPQEKSWEAPQEKSWGSSGSGSKDWGASEESSWGSQQQDQNASWKRDGSRALLATPKSSGPRWEEETAAPANDGDDWGRGARQQPQANSWGSDRNRGWAQEEPEPASWEQDHTMGDAPQPASDDWGPGANDEWGGSSGVWGGDGSTQLQATSKGPPTPAPRTVAPRGKVVPPKGRQPYPSAP